MELIKKALLTILVMPSLCLYGDLCDYSSNELITDPDYLKCLGDQDPEMHIPAKDRRTPEECLYIWAKDNACGQYIEDNPPPPYDFSNRVPYREPPPK